MLCMLHGITLQPLPTARASRRDGRQARTRLLHAAVRLFAEKGFDKASTREIAQAAGVNIAAISYYFGDKAGLYRAALADAQPTDTPTHAGGGEISLREALEAHFSDGLNALRDRKHSMQRARLRLRQALETPDTDDQATPEDDDARTVHRDLVKRIGEHVHAVPNDPDLAMLAWAITGLSLPFIVHFEAVRGATPVLVDNIDAIDTMALRLADHAMGMIEAERERRQAIAAAPRRPEVTTAGGLS